MSKRHDEAEAAIRKQFNLAPEAPVHVCMADDMHPYNCDGMFGGSCIHCDGMKDDEHDPVTCALCNWDNDHDV